MDNNIVIGVLLVLAFIGYSIWSIRRGMRVIYPAGTWLELLDPTDATNIDSEFGPEPQYFRLDNDYTVSKSEDRWSFGGCGWSFEPDGKLKQSYRCQPELYKACDPKLAAKLEARFNKQTKAQENSDKARIVARRKRALKLYLKGSKS